MTRLLPSPRRRRGRLALVALAAALTSWGVLGAGAGQVVLVRSSELAPYKAVEKAFLGAIGRPVTVLNLATEADAVKAALAEGPALVVSVGPDAAKAVLEAKPTAPVVHTLVPTPEKLGAAEVARTVPMFVAPQRQVRLVKELLPKVKRVGVVYDPSLSKAMVEDYARAAQEGGLTLVRQEIHQKSEVATAVRGLLGKIDALWLIPDATLIGVDTFKFLVQTSLESKIPLVGFSQGTCKAGVLLALEADYAEMGREAAAVGRKQLTGSPATPEAAHGTVYLNGRTAGVLDISIPDSVRQQAAAVF